jgi:hypothetical protein
MPDGAIAEKKWTLRDRIHVIRKQLRDDDLSPALVRESLVTLTALQGNVADERRQRDQEYRLVYLNCLNAENKANRARIVAETTPAYWRLVEARDVEEECKQMIVTCRAYLRSLDEEMRLAR